MKPSTIRPARPGGLRLAMPCLLLPLWMGSGLAAGAAEFTLDSVAAYAQSHNPDLSAARHRIDEARGRLLQSGRISNPELEGGVKPNVRGREFGADIGLTLKLPLTNRLSLEKAVSRAEVAAAEAEVRTAEQLLAAKVRAGALGLLALQESRGLKGKQITANQELAKAAAQSAERGEGSPVEASQYELEAQQLELDLLQLDAEQEVLAGQLRPLLGLAAAETVAMKGSLPAARVPSPADVNLSVRGDYAAAQARIEAARQGVALARAQRWQDVGIGVSAEVDRNEDYPAGLETDSMVGIRFSLPLPLRGSNQGKVDEARAAAARAEKEAEALAAQVRAEAAAAYAEMRAARKILDRTADSLLPKALEIEQRLAKLHAEGQPGTQFADVLRARDKRLALEQARVHALRDFHLARIRYEAALGR